MPGAPSAFATPLHIGQEVTVPLDVWAGAAALVGLGAAVALLLVRRSVLATPARVVAGVLGRRAPADVSPTSVATVHCASGLLAGLSYVLVAADTTSALPAFPTVNDIAVFPHLLGVALTVVVLAVAADTAFLVHETTRERLWALRRRWALVTATYGLALLVCVPLFVRLYALSVS